MALNHADKLMQAGCDLGVSDWLPINQIMNQAFADVTLDPVPMQIEGQVFAHGFLTMSLLAHLMADAMKAGSSGNIMKQGYALNYGFNRLRLIEPVPLGSRIRGHFRTSDRGIVQRDAITIIAVDVRIEIEHNERPAMIAEWLMAWKK
jgi:acyl dehydratase